MLVACVVCSIGTYWMLKNYLHSDGFRRLLSTNASKALDMEGEFSPFHWDGLVVDTNSFAAKGNGLVASLHADHLHTEVNLAGVRRGVWELHGTNINRLEIFLDARTNPVNRNAPPIIAENPPVKPSSSGWLPSEVEINDLDLREVVVNASLDEGDVFANGMRVHIERTNDKNDYRSDIDGGRIRLPWPWLPELNINRVRLRYHNGGIFVTDAATTAFKQGRIDGSGEWNPKQQQYSFEGNARGIKCDELLREDWAKRLTGDMSSSFVIESRSTGPLFKGSLTLKNGILTALPMLDALAAYADTRRFRMLVLNTAHSDWRWQQGEITFSNLVLSSESLIRLEGQLVIRNRVLDGAFRLGLAPGTLAAIPGAETDVFLPGEGGLLWTPLRITGTIDDPKEDLSGRLMAAAENRMFDVIPETGEKVLKFTRSILDGSATIEKGVDVIDQATDTIMGGVGGVLNGILGGAPPDKPALRPNAQPKPE